MDYRDVEGKYIDPFFKYKGERFQYKIEHRGKCLHIVELNFKPNTDTAMSMPVPLYNQFVEWLNDHVAERGVLANNVLPTFTQFMDNYRKDYLGGVATLKSSSYIRYASVFYLFWKATKGLMGFEADLIPQRSVPRIIQRDGVTALENEIEARGYYIKPVGNRYVIIIDKTQKKLGDY
jgi:hypothetical protein